MWVRYHASPIGAYDELLILDHPLFRQRRLSTIPKIFVSTESSVQQNNSLRTFKKTGKLLWFLRARVRADFSQSKNRYCRLIIPRETG